MLQRHVDGLARRVAARGQRLAQVFGDPVVDPGQRVLERADVSEHRVMQRIEPVVEFARLEFR